MRKEILLTKSIEVVTLESGYYQIQVDNIELAEMMNSISLLDKNEEFSYRILNVVYNEKKEKPQQVTFTTTKKLGNSIDMVLVRKKLFTVVLESIKGG